jgi:hypothetical protein
MTTSTESTDLLGPLRARLEGIDKRREAENQRHKGVLQGLDQEAATIKAMIALEEKLTFGGPVKPKQPLRPGARNEIESEILGLLSDRGIWQLNAIKMHLIHKGLGRADDPQLGRATHALLLSMSKRGAVAYRGEGQWQAAAIRKLI